MNLAGIALCGAAARSPKADPDRNREEQAMKAARLIPIGLAAAITCAAALLVPAGASAGSSNHQYRWDIIHLSGPPPVTTTLPGGKASACAASSCASMITLTGSGTFRANPGGPQTGVPHNSGIREVAAGEIRWSAAGVLVERRQTHRDTVTG